MYDLFFFFANLSFCIHTLIPIQYYYNLLPWPVTEWRFKCNKRKLTLTYTIRYQKFFLNSIYIRFSVCHRPRERVVGLMEKVIWRLRKYHDLLTIWLYKTDMSERGYYFERSKGLKPLERFGVKEWFKFTIHNYFLPLRIYNQTHRT